MAPVVEDKMKQGGIVNGPPTLLEEMKMLKEMQDQNGGSSCSRKPIHSELWHACAGPLVYLPQVGSLVYYFPQGHSEQVAVSTKRCGTTQIPNYPNLPSQLLCQVHNVTLHADKDTDEIFAQMSLQPIKSEKDVYPIPDFGLKPSKHPTEFFCKTLTASDTSTHGGFSVPRRAAEKLFPPLDYTMQPPTQELIVKDLHDNTWTFRHIYRGQPKRHLLTTGWSVFVGSKRLRAGDSVLFIRDEKSQLMIGVRRANRPQTALPSSVLSADSMHIGVLAAAAHASVNRTPFTVFYNPRACPADFVIPVNKYRKAIYGTQISVGMRFGMMFETEESGKRRYMGTIVGINDLDPLRWPGSKWRNLQVEWDEPGCGDKQNRVSSWEIETPESLFLFPSLTSGFKRPFPPSFIGGDFEWSNLLKRPLLHQTPDIAGSGNLLPYPTMSNLCSEQLIKMLLRPQNSNYPSPLQTPPYPSSTTTTDVFEGAKPKLPTPAAASTLQRPQLAAPGPGESYPVQSNHLSGQSCLNRQITNLVQGNISVEEHQKTNKNPDQIVGAPAVERANNNNNNNNKPEAATASVTNVVYQLDPAGQCSKDKMGSSSSNTMITQPNFQAQPNNNAQRLMQPSLEAPQNHKSSQTTALTASSQLDLTNLNSFLPYTDLPDWLPYSTSAFQSLPGLPQSPNLLSMFGKQDQSSSLPDVINSILPPMNQELWEPQMLRDPQFAHCDPNTAGMVNLSDDTNNHSGTYSCLDMDAVNNVGGSSEVTRLHVDPSSTVPSFDGDGGEFGALKDVSGFQYSSDCMVGNFNSSQDLQSQITSASLVDSQAFSIQEFPDNSGGTSSSNVDFDESSLLQNASWQPVTAAPPLRSFTKVQKSGSVGRSIDVTSFKSYDELRLAIECMFGLDGLLSDPRGSSWKLVYVDFENDVLLVGDDPWEEFVSCVRCIRILSPAEVKQMSEEGMQLLNNANPAQKIGA